MSKPKTKPAPSDGEDPKKRLALNMRLDPETDQALTSFIQSQRVEPDRSAVGIKALREFLQREGFWPPTAET